MSQTMVDTYKTLTYDEWLEDDKHKSKVKKTGANGSITAYDEKENRAMYDAYVAEVNAQNAYKTAQGTLDANKAYALDANASARADTMRENAILEARAKEYAERRAKMNGTSSAGVSQTAMVDLMSQMAGARANAQASYDNQEKTIIQDYQDAIYEAQRARDNAIMTAQSNANAIAADAGVQRAQENETIRQGKVTDVENALANYGEGNITLEELTKIYNANKDVLGENDAAIIDEYKNLINEKTNEKSEYERFLSNTNYNDSTEQDESELIKRKGKINAVDFKVTDTSPSISKGNISLEEINKLIDNDGTGSGDEQDRWVEQVVAMIKNGQIADGTIIDMNYGSIDGENTGNYFLYYKGRLYQTNFEYSDVDFNLKGVDTNYAANEDAMSNEMYLEINGNKVRFLRKD